MQAVMMSTAIAQAYTLRSAVKWLFCSDAIGFFLPIFIPPHGESPAMLKMSIKPQWQPQGAAGPEPMPHLLKLLLKVHETHTLAKAAQQLGLSYRYAWGVLQDG